MFRRIHLTSSLSLLLLIIVNVQYFLDYLCCCTVKLTCSQSYKPRSKASGILQSSKFSHHSPASCPVRSDHRCSISGSRRPASRRWLCLRLRPGRFH
ncbi:hypothetical protein RvY_14741-2 [Ramazzottius varieornatus]|uniref:Secreted protein n=1 Tax=Ramazzottius varieornatus TaxID=947166 RepID=A0A1D1VSH2_RAMVA|nr:hypothetical protein RvY_14741-2 [Ramazzottius varieornatus]